ncbi:hypothetical protein ACLB2K_042585 [Fragaria x ananassa]
MAATQIPEVVLVSSNGRRTMPVLSFGTAANNLEPEVLKEAVLEAIKLGYRHFDTAYEYGSEQSLGIAIAKALELGLVASRDELFITSKLWPNDAHPDLVIPALKKSLQNLQLEYLDLYLIHWPISATPGKLSHVLEEKDQMPMDFKGVWAYMEEAQRLGLTKSIGISNFSTKKTQNLLSFATIPPSVNQVEMSPFWQQKKLRDFCKANVLNEIAEAHGNTVPQICIRWVYQVGATLAVKSYNKERLKHNVQVFDWELSEEDLDKIGQIPQHRMMLREGYVTANGPYKSLEELWDGEL